MVLIFIMIKNTRQKRKKYKVQTSLILASNGVVWLKVLAICCSVSCSMFRYTEISARVANIDVRCRWAIMQHRSCHEWRGVDKSADFIFDVCSCLHSRKNGIVMGISRLRNWLRQKSRAKKKKICWCSEAPQTQTRTMEERQQRKTIRHFFF